ncbi:MAG: undecaprenyldiphospho-muramoylpentapeptide beta-N-acetylglucosaminyltransferase [Micrococcales bacterium]|nr:undecaprenyldiphospho-muramoylpentapeptide beta-N-acetylglucosaminyltransferase [Micrococcales bacterium]
MTGSRAAAPSSVVLAGGGSAGHVSPLLALADALVRRDPDVRITALGTATGLEARLVPARGYELRTIDKVAFPRRISGDALRLPHALWGAVAAVDTVLRDSGARVVVGFGGYVSAPAYLAARRCGIPIVIHEQNARPGLANRLGARLTPFVATTFATTALPHARVLGMPLRAEIAGLDRAALRAQAREHFGLDPDAPTLLVTGGSLGAQRLNQGLGAAAATLIGSGAQVLHLAGIGKEFEPLGVTGSSGPGRYVVLAYAERMELAYAAADLVVARSGANTVCELSAVGLPAIFVPLPIGNGEQRLNAAGVVAAGGGLLADDAEVDAAWVERVVVPLLADPQRLARMAAAAAHAGQRHADERLADLVHRAYQEGV